MPRQHIEQYSLCIRKDADSRMNLKQRQFDVKNIQHSCEKCECWKKCVSSNFGQTFSRSARSILEPVLNSLRSRSTLLNDDEYFGKVGGGMGLAAMAGFSCDLFTL